MNNIWLKIWLKIRRVGFEIYCFLTAPFVVKNCLSMFGLLAGLFVMTFWWLKCYTNHGDSIQVPNFVGMGFREAVKKARAHDFGVAVSDSVYIPGKVPGEIISQNPEPNGKVKEGRTIYFTVAKNNPDVVRLPDLVGADDYETYSRKVLRLGLKPRVAARVAVPRLEPNTIVAVIYRGDTITNKISRGFSLEVGGTLDFVLSEAPNQETAIPDCLCQTLSEARFLVQAAQLTIGAIIKDASVTDPESAYIWQQKPGYDATQKMKIGESIDLYLTQERPQKCQ